MKALFVHLKIWHDMILAYTLTIMLLYSQEGRLYERRQFYNLISTNRHWVKKFPSWMLSWKSWFLSSWEKEPLGEDVQLKRKNFQLQVFRDKRSKQRKAMNLTFPAKDPITAREAAKPFPQYAKLSATRVRNTLHI